MRSLVADWYQTPPLKNPGSAHEAIIIHVCELYMYDILNFLDIFLLLEPAM